MMIAASDVPVVPCRISGAFEAMPPNCSAARPRRIAVRFGVPLRFDDVPNSKVGWKQIASRTEQAVMALD